LADGFSETGTPMLAPVAVACRRLYGLLMNF
jgi:hypothetical protein